MHQFSPTLSWEFTSLNRGWILLHHPRPPLLGAGLETSSPHRRNLSGDLTQKVRTRRFCASRSLSVFTPSLSPEAASCFWFLLPVAWTTWGAISLRRNQGLLRLIKESFPSPVVLYSGFPSASPWRVVCLWLCFLSFSTQPTKSPWNEPTALFLVPELTALWPRRKGRKEKRKREQNSRKSCKWGNQTHDRFRARSVIESERPNCSTDWATGHGLVAKKQYTKILMMW